MLQQSSTESWFSHLEMTHQNKKNPYQSQLLKTMQNRSPRTGEGPIEFVKNFTLRETQSQTSTSSHRELCVS
jgi:hypothetical protein